MAGKTYADKFKLWAIRAVVAAVAGALIGAAVFGVWTGYDVVAGADERRARLVEVERKVEEARLEVQRLRLNAAELRHREPNLSVMALNNADTQEQRVNWLTLEAELIRSGPQWGEQLTIGAMLGAVTLGVVPAALAAWFLFLLMLRQIAAAVRGQDE